jgi:hypothetical protein
MARPAAVSPVTEVVEFFARGPSRETIAAFRLSPDAREKILRLLEKNAAGTLTGEEERELDQMILLDDILSLIRARAGGSSINDQPVCRQFLQHCAAPSPSRPSTAANTAASPTTPRLCRMNRITALACNMEARLHLPILLMHASVAIVSKNPILRRAIHRPGRWFPCSIPVPSVGRYTSGWMELRSFRSRSLVAGPRSFCASTTSSVCYCARNWYVKGDIALRRLVRRERLQLWVKGKRPGECPGLFPCSAL